jgi:cyclophilin family peptidyl-prolyl cis-trans isomerase/HEAT repeat protein
MKNSIVLLILCSMLYACGGKKNKFSDATQIKIAEFQDRRLSDSLYRYFNDENKAYRESAVLAFASIQDTFAIDKLTDVLLYDAEPEIRKAAAIALGQIAVNPAAGALWNALRKEKDTSVLREIIESCGKTFKKKDLGHLNMGSADELVIEGLAWAYYRLGLRQLADSTMTITAMDFLKPGRGLQTRLAAANFYARGATYVNLAEPALITAAQSDESPWIRAAVTTALRKVQTENSLNAIKRILETDKDYRVRSGAARALQDFPWDKAKSALIDALKDENVNVAITASEAIRSMPKQDQEKELAALAKNTANWRVRANLYEGALIDSNSVAIVNEIIEQYKIEKNPYGKAALLVSLGQSTLAWNFINQELQQSTIPVIKSSAATALISVNANIYFDKGLYPEFVNMYKQAIQTGDAAVIGIVAGALMNRLHNYKSMITDYSFLHEAKQKLSLPKDNEALQPLEEAIAFFEGKKAAPVKNEFNHPINWDLVKTIPKDQKVLIKTSKGDVVLKLLVEEAPGSVANFVELINKKYFDEKNFHRVVPNFVIQGGCNRGDGWGSEDYSIRSEFNEMHYTEGSVGMASAGKDTEGTQWFITHSPTPHLNGRYSIFAVTESGMDIVHRIEVGDMIVSVTLIQ